MLFGGSSLDSGKIGGTRAYGSKWGLKTVEPSAIAWAATAVSY